MEQNKKNEEIQVIIFSINEVKYGISIDKIIEVIKMEPITPLPKTPEFIKGVINLRGKVIPVIDLRERFGLPSTEYTSDTRIIITLIEEKKEIGLIVDAVYEVLTIDSSIIEPPLPMVGSLKSEYINGIAKLESNLVLIIDIEKILTSEEKVLLKDREETLDKQ